MARIIYGIFFMSFLLLISLSWSVIQQNNNLVLNITQNGVNNISFNLTEMNNTLTAKNFSGVGNFSTLFYLDIPKNSTVISANLTLTGIVGGGSGIFEIHLPILQDVYVFQGQPNNNFGSQNNVLVGLLPSGLDNENRTAWFLVNTSEISNKSLITGQLRLNKYTHLSSSVDANLTAYYATNNIWSETTITWNNQPIGSVVKTTLLDKVQVNASPTFSGLYQWNVLTALNIYRNEPTMTLYLEAIGKNGALNFCPKAFFLNDCPDGNQSYINITFENLPNVSSVTLDISNDGDNEFSESSNFTTTNITNDFSSEINTFLNTCSPNTKGLCQVPINLSGFNGSVEVSNIQIKFNYSLSPLFNTTDRWDIYSHINASTIINKTKDFNNTYLNASYNLSLYGILIDGTDCQINNSNNATTGGICQYHFNVSQGNKFPQFKLRESGFGNGIAINKFNHSWKDNTYNYTQNITINFTNLNGVLEIANKFINGSTGLICNNGSVIMNPFLQVLNNSLWLNLTPTAIDSWQYKNISGTQYWVRMSDFCYSDSINDFLVNIEQNPANDLSFRVGGNVTISTNLTIIDLVSSQPLTSVNIWSDYTDQLGTDILDALCSTTSPAVNLSYDSVDGRYEGSFTTQSTSEDGVILNITCSKENYINQSKLDSYNVQTPGQGSTASAAPAGGGGSGEPQEEKSVCGNAVCEVGETLITCQQDCINVSFIVYPEFYNQFGQPGTLLNCLGQARGCDLGIYNPSAVNQSVRLFIEPIKTIDNLLDPSYTWAQLEFNKKGSNQVVLSIPAGNDKRQGESHIIILVNIPKDIERKIYEFNVIAQNTLTGEKKIAKVRFRVGDFDLFKHLFTPFIAFEGRASIFNWLFLPLWYELLIVVGIFYYLMRVLYGRKKRN